MISNKDRVNIPSALTIAGMVVWPHVNGKGFDIVLWVNGAFPYFTLLVVGVFEGILYFITREDNGFNGFLPKIKKEKK